MRLLMRLPAVQPGPVPTPTVCPYAGCGGQHFKRRQAVTKPLRDTKLDAVAAHRYGCVRCGRTFRAYPPGVSRAQTSARLRGLGVLLYLLGLSYGAAALTLEALGHPLSKVAVYDAVQAAGAKVPGLRRDAVRLPVGRRLVAALGADLTSVKCNGEWLTVGVSVDALGGAALTVDVLDSGEAADLVAWLAEVAAAVGAELLVSDDADGFKTAADAAGLSHQVCKAHVVRNTEAWVARMEPALAEDADGSLALIRVGPDQAVADARALLRLVRQRDPTPEAAADLRAIHRRYQGAPPPRKGEAAGLAYRLRLFSLDRWQLWDRLTRYRTWATADGEVLDGTNNATERAIGWWVKERYRSMRGYQRKASVLNVSRLIAWAGNGLQGHGVDLALVVP
jgi:hypothetical protein